MWWMHLQKDGYIYISEVQSEFALDAWTIWVMKYQKGPLVQPGKVKAD